jgi:hypothetical protein
MHSFICSIIILHHDPQHVSSVGGGRGGGGGGWGGGVGGGGGVGAGVGAAAAGAGAAAVCHEKEPPCPTRRAVWLL